MNILVTGGAGFIGSHLVDALLDLKHKVIVIDNLSSGFKKNLNFSNTQLIFIKQDICDDLEDIFQEYKPEIIFHLAAQIDVRYSMEASLEDAQINILGSLNLIKKAVEHKLKKFIFSSTGGVMYGSPMKIPVDESYPAQPLCNYGLTKKTIEEYLNLYQKHYSLSYIALRYGNVYGPRQNPFGEAGVVAIFIAQLLRREVPTLFDKGRQKRDYIYINDVVAANLRAMESPCCGIYNIGTGLGTNTREILDYIQEGLGVKTRFRLAPARLGEIKQIALDSGKAWRKFRWRPKYALEQGIQETIEYFKKNKQINAK